MILTLLMLINMSRVTPLVEYPLLQQQAIQRAQDIYISGNFSHTGWQGYFKGTDCYYGGENIARGYDDMYELHDAFMHSPSHRKNILGPRYNSVGIGSYGNIIVELFCQR